MTRIWIVSVSPCRRAQTWKDDLGTYQLRSCYTVKEGVRCDFFYTMTAKANERVYFDFSAFEAVSQDGQTVMPSAVAAAGGAFQDRIGPEISVYKGAPVPVSVLFALPSTTRTLRVLAVNKEAATNVPVATVAGAARPVVTTPAPAAQVPTGFSLVLSDCKVTSGVYTCTATLTPTR